MIQYNAIPYVKKIHIFMLQYGSVHISFFEFIKAFSMLNFSYCCFLV